MVIVQVSNEFADGVVRDLAEGGRLEAGRREIDDELAEILTVVGNRMR
jgi:hypothetical protein